MDNRWMQKLYWNNDAFKDSTNFEHIKTHYYWSHVAVSSILHFHWPSMAAYCTHLWPRSTPPRSSLLDLFPTLGHCKNKNFVNSSWISVEHWHVSFPQQYVELALFHIYHFVTSQRFVEFTFEGYLEYGISAGSTCLKLLGFINLSGSMV